ncbi:MAG TPA: site-specific integrase [Rubricoccaceae bacterium]|jgi:integrase
MLKVHLRRKDRPDGSVIGYYAEFVNPLWARKKVWRTLRTADEREAHRRLAEMEREANLGVYDPVTGRRAGGTDVTLQAALDAYVAHSRTRLAPGTIRAKQSRVGAFVRTFPPGTVARGVTARQIEAFLGSLQGRNRGKGAEDLPRPPAQAHTRHGYYSQLCGFFSWLVAEGHAPESPMGLVNMPEPPTSERVVLRPAEIERVKRALDADLFPGEGGTLYRSHRGWLADVVDFTAATGLRVAEVAALNWDAVEVWTGDDGEPSGVVYVTSYSGRGGARSFTTKTGGARRLPLFPRAAAVLLRLAERRTGERREPVFRAAWGGALSPQEITRRFTEYVERSRIAKPATFHSLRHTFISWCCNDLALPVPTVQRLAGHKDIQTTMRYVHTSEDTLVDALDLALSRGGVEAKRKGRRPSQEEVARWLAGTPLEGAPAEPRQNVFSEGPETGVSVPVA